MQVLVETSAAVDRPQLDSGKGWRISGFAANSECFGAYECLPMRRHHISLVIVMILRDKIRGIIYDENCVEIERLVFDADRKTRMEKDK